MYAPVNYMIVTTVLFSFLQSVKGGVLLLIKTIDIDSDILISFFKLSNLHYSDLMRFPHNVT